MGAEVRVRSAELHVEDDAENTQKIIAVQFIVFFKLTDVGSHTFVSLFTDGAAINGASCFLEYTGVDVLLHKTTEDGDERMLPAKAVNFTKFGIKCDRGMIIWRSCVQTNHFRDDGPRITQQNKNLCFVVHIFFNRHLIFRLCTTIY